MVLQRKCSNLCILLNRIWPVLALLFQCSYRVMATKIHVLEIDHRKNSGYIAEFITKLIKEPSVSFTAAYMNDISITVIYYHVRVIRA